MCRVNKTILEKAERIIEKEEELNLYKEKCIRANLCPLCGSELTKIEDNVWHCTVNKYYCKACEKIIEW